MRRAPLWTGAVAAYPWHEGDARAFTPESRFGEPFEMWTKVGSYLGLPRQFCPLSKDDRRIEGQKIPFTSSVIPRNDEQDRVIGEATELLDAGRSFVLESPTGSGKTVMACELIARTSRKTLIIVPKEDLMGQWHEELKKHLGLKDSEIGVVWQNKYDVANKKVILGMLASLSIPNRYPKELSKEPGLVIWDEVHRLPAPTFSATASMFPGLRRLGLSATPTRIDGKEMLVYGHIGQVEVCGQLVPMIPIVATYASPWKVPKRGGRKLFHSAGKDGHIKKMLMRDQARNELITHLLKKAYDQGRKTVVFSDQLAHLEQMHVMAAQSGIPTKDLTFYIGGMKAPAREKASVKPVIFATYQMMSEGTNIPWLDCCILASPRSNVKQVVGRVLREHPGKPRPVILDIVDHDSHVYASYAKKRWALYQELGAELY